MRRQLTMCLVLTVCVSACSRAREATNPAESAASSSVQVAIDDLRTDYGDAVVELDASNEVARSIELGRPVSPPPSTDSTRIAMQFVDEREALFAGRQAGFEARPRGGEQPDSQIPGATVVRLGQFVRGVEVFGGELVVRVRPTGADAGVMSVTNSSPVPAAVDTTPSITAAAAQATAVAEYREYVAGLDPAQRPDEPEQPVAPRLVLFDPARFGLEGTAALTWLVDIGVRRVFVDAHAGRVAYAYRNAPDAAQRLVYDCNVSPCAVAFDGDTQVGKAVSKDASGLSASARDVHDYFLKVHQRDGYADAARGGRPRTEAYALSPKVRGADYEPARKQLRFAPGWAARDLYAHEFTHALMYHQPAVEYLGQAGAVHEFYADLFAALSENPSPARWLIGETVATLPAQRAYLRDLRNPHANGFDRAQWAHAGSNNGQPEHMDELVMPSHRICAVREERENGCAHFNGAILSKAATLAVDGGAHRGVTVTGIGAPKYQRIAYAALQSLGGSPLLADVARELVAACARAVTTRQLGMAATDCTQVTSSLRAVGLR